MDGEDGEGDAEEDGGEDDAAFAEVGGEGPDDEFGEVVEDAAAFFDGGFDAGEVVVDEDHVCGSFGDVCAGDAHGDADVCLFEGWGVVYAVTGHGDDVAAGLECADEAEFLFGCDAGEDFGFFREGGEVFV